MKIGILSMQRICNYGSFLQAWALQHLLQEMGHEVCFVDYTPGPVLCPEDRPPLSRRLRGKCRSLWQMRSRRSRMLRKQERNETFQQTFQREYLPLLGLSKERRCRIPVDLLIIGSDEVFHCMQSNPQVGYAKELFGEGNRANRVVSFAASFGCTTLSMLREKGIDGEIGRMLSRFSALSVRDCHSWEMVRALTGREAYLHIDPVLLYDFSRKTPSAPCAGIRSSYTPMPAGCRNRKLPRSRGLHDGREKPYCPWGLISPSVRSIFPKPLRLNCWLM